MKYFFKFIAAISIAAIIVGCADTQERNSTNETVSAEEIALLDTLWQRQFIDAKSIITLYDSIEQTTATENKGTHILNQCHFVWHRQRQLSHLCTFHW